MLTIGSVDLRDGAADLGRAPGPAGTAADRQLQLRPTAEVRTILLYLYYIFIHIYIIYLQIYFYSPPVYCMCCIYYELYVLQLCPTAEVRTILLYLCLYLYLYFIVSGMMI
jgi:hypothetical protein